MRDLLLAAAILGVILAAAAARDPPPRPRPADAPTGEFSAVRAQAFLRRFLGDGAPRPVGSESNDRAAMRIVAELRALGYAPAIQEAFDCGLYGACAHVRNVVARLAPGSPADRAGQDATTGDRREPTPRAVLLVAHHDSVPAGPGAADDGAGVAALLEVARALRSGPPLPRPVLFLADDGEEVGLAGASAFARQHPWAREVGAVVNLEARGTSGPSLMFETSGPSAWIARLLRHLPRPRASSLFAAVYALLPNDTDLTVFERRGVPGMNFAFIGDAERYHTAGDDLAHLDMASLQHQGEDALAAVRALVRSDLEHPPRGDAVFFDVLGLAVAAWPTSAALPLALAGLLAAAATALLLRRRHGLTLRAAAWGAAAFLAAPLVAACLGFGLRAAAVGVDLEAGLYAAQPVAFVAGAWAAGIAGAIASAWAASGRTSAVGAWAGAALGWSILAVAVSAALPAASHVFTAPALVAGAVGLAWASRPAATPTSATLAPPVRTRTRSPPAPPFDPGSSPGRAAARGTEAWSAGAGSLSGATAGSPTRDPTSRRSGWALVAVLATAAAAALIAFPLAWLLPSAAGSLAAPMSAALVALVAASLSPLVVQRTPRERRLLALFAAGAAMAAGAAGAIAFRTSGEGQRIAIAFHEEGGAARWLVEADALPASMRRIAPFARAPGPLMPGSIGPGFAAAAAPLGLPPPTLTVIERRALPGGLTRLRARLASARGAPAVMLALPASAQVVSAAVGGVPVAGTRRRFRRFLGEWQVFGCLTTPPQGVEIRIEWTSEGPVEAVLIDRSTGLPAAGAALSRARPPGSLSAGEFTAASARVKL
jgi:hypothetical protein